MTRGEQERRRARAPAPAPLLPIRRPPLTAIRPPARLAGRPTAARSPAARPPGRPLARGGAALAAALLAGGGIACVPRPITPPGMVLVGARELPSRVVDDRFFAAPVTTGGDTLLLLVETGGPASMLYVPTVARLALEPRALVAGSDTAWLVDLPALAPEAEIPPPASFPDIGQQLFVHPGDGGDEAGFLGQSWLAARTWTFDYRRGRLELLPPGVLPPHDARNAAPLGFRLGEDGARLLHVPRIRVAIAGDSLDLVLDTGAQARLSDAAAAALAGRPTDAAVRGVSFASLPQVEAWRRRHPDWPVIEGADLGTGLPMIRVPHVRVAGQDLGPVWFVAAPTERYPDHASRLTDRPVHGALGGNALRGFAVTLDYQRGVAVFGRE